MSRNTTIIAIIVAGLGLAIGTGIYVYPEYSEAREMEKILRKDQAGFRTVLAAAESKAITLGEYEKQTSTSIDERQKLIVITRGSFDRIPHRSTEAIADLLNNENEVLRVRLAEVNKISAYSEIVVKMGTAQKAFDAAFQETERGIKNENLASAGYGLTQVEQLLQIKKNLLLDRNLARQALVSGVKEFCGSFHTYQIARKHAISESARDRIRFPEIPNDLMSRGFNDFERAEMEHENKQYH